MLVIRGVNVYPSEVEAVLVAEPAVGPNYLLVVDRTETMPKLVVACELTAARDGDAERERAQDSIAGALFQRLGLSTEVRVLPVGTLPRIEMGKAKRVADKSPESNPLPGVL
jgi:phenylacetate-CoA ligase